MAHDDGHDLSIDQFDHIVEELSMVELIIVQAPDELLPRMHDDVTGKGE